jgi:PAS domain S-box-containing protein
MNQDKIDILKRNLKKEKVARKAAEKIAENKSYDLSFLRAELKRSNIEIEWLKEQNSSSLDFVFQHINDAYVKMDLFGNILNMNNIAMDFFGYDLEKENLSVYNLIYPEDLEYAIRSFNILKKKGVFTNYRTRILTRSKQVKWIQINGVLVFDVENKPIGAQGIIRDVTSEKKAENLLIESESMLSSLIDNIDSAVLLEDENRNIILTNTKFCELFNITVSPDTLIGESCFTTENNNKILFKNPKKFISRIADVLEHKQQVLGDELMMVDGTILERDFIPILKGNEYKSHLWTYKNVSLKKQYRKSLEIQKGQYSNITANMNLGLVELNIDDEILLANQSFSEMSGYSQEELLGKRAKDVFELVNGLYPTEIKTDKGQNENMGSYEIKIKKKSGAIRNLLISSVPNYDINGQVIGSIKIYLDVTEARENAELIDEKKEELDTIVHNSTIGIVLTRRGRIIKTNVALQQMLGFSDTELNKLTLKNLTFAEDYSSFKAYLAQIEADNTDNFSFIKKYKKKDGTALWTKTNVSIVRDKNRHIKHQVAHLEDITTSREKSIIIDLINNLTKSILGKTNIREIAWEIVNNIAAYLDSEDCVIYLVDQEKQTTEQIAVYGDKLGENNTIINKMVIKKGMGIVGSVANSGQSELIKDTSKDKRYIIDQNSNFSEITVPIISNGIVIGIIDSEHKEKNHFTEEHIKTLESIASLAAIKLRTAISIREYKKVELRNDHLRTKLENSNDELNEYAHIVSHDLKSPLRSIDALVSWIKTDNIDVFDIATLQNFKLIEETLEKMEQLISDILFYSSLDSKSSEKQNVNLNNVIEDIQKILFIPKNISIEVLNKLPLVKGERTKFQQLFQNLISNAIKFSDKEKGLIQIDVKENKSFYQFSVKDNGIGIEKKYLNKVFKFFHSLNPSKGSSGIGLSIVKKIVDLYKGEIWIESKPKIGTTFHFTLKK